MTAKTKRAVAARARRFFKALADGKDKYSRADRMLREIRELGMKPGDRVQFNRNGDKVRLDDLFEKDDKVFRAHGIGRFQLSIEKASQ